MEFDGLVVLKSCDQHGTGLSVLVTLHHKTGSIVSVSGLDQVDVFHNMTSVQGLMDTIIEISLKSVLRRLRSPTGASY